MYNLKIKPVGKNRPAAIIDIYI